MTKEIKKKLTLDRPATYQIKVPGTIDVARLTGPARWKSL